MAIRKLRFNEDPILHKKTRKIEDITERIKQLRDDMIETMNEAEGVGLAAPQIGVLRRAVVIDVGQGPLKLINPEILEVEGEVVDVEGCLSVPGRSGTVSRPEKVKIRYLDEDGNEKELESEGLLARAICHEIDHLEGVLYTDKMIEEIIPEEDEEV